MKTLFRIPVLIAALGLVLMFLPSCAIHPTIKDGSTIITLGGELGMKSTNAWAEVTRPDGTTLRYGNTGSDGTVPIKSYITGSVMKFAAGATAGVMKNASGNALKAAKSTDEVTKHLSDNASAVEIAKIPPAP